MKDLISVIKDYECKKKEKIKTKLHNERNNVKLFKILLIVFWIMFFFCILKDVYLMNVKCLNTIF